MTLLVLSEKENSLFTYTEKTNVILRAVCCSKMKHL